MNMYVEALLRTLLSIAVIFVLARLNGSKQVSQLTFYDYIVGISAGSISAAMCIEEDIDIWVCLIAVIIFMLSSLFFSVLTSKSIILRRLFTGQAVFLIDEGEISYDGLRRAHFDLNDLMRELRAQGYFDFNQVNYAILEANGNLSVMPKAGDRPLTAAESGASLPEDGLLSNVVLDGKIMKGKLTAFGLKIIPNMSDGELVDMADTFAEQIEKEYNLDSITVARGNSYSDFETNGKAPLYNDPDDYEEPEIGEVYIYPHHFQVSYKQYFTGAQVAVSWYRAAGRNVYVDDDQMVFVSVGKGTDELMTYTLPIAISDSQREEARKWEMGIVARYVLPVYQDYYNLPQGAYLRSVEEGSPAQEAGLQEGDIIVGIGEQTILGDMTLRLSRASFCIYLVHIAVLRLLGALGLHANRFAMLSIPGVAVLCGAISYFIYLPLSKLPWIKRWLI